RLGALLVLACGYLFSALIIIPHALTFPGAFSPTGLLGAGLQTTASLYWFWHLLFPVALLGYGLMRDENPDPAPAQPSLLAVIVRGIALVLVLVCGLTLLATAGNDYLPPLFADRVDFTPAARLAAATTMLTSASAVAVLWLRRRSLLDEWLMIVALAALLEMALGAMFVSERFSLGFYAGRAFSLLTSTIVLVVLLAETTRLYANVTRSNEGKIRCLVDANILGICISNLEGAIVEANEAFLRMLQFSREDIASRRLRWTDLTPADWREQSERAVAELRSTGTFHPVEKEYFRKDGSRVPVLIGGALFEKSRNEGVVFVLDLTELKSAEQAVRNSERKLRQFVESVPCHFWSANPNGEPTYVNRRLLDYFGMRFEDQKSSDWQAVLHPDDVPETERALYYAFRTGESFQRVHRLRRADGEYRWHRARAEPQRDHSGNNIQWYGFSIDIDEGKKAEDALRESERSLRSAIDGIAGLIAILAANGEFETVNRQLFEYCSRSWEELQNWATNDIVHPEDLPRILELFKRSIAAGIPFQFELRLRRFDGDYRWFENRIVPIRDDSGRIIRWYALLVDIEDRTRALERLQQLQSDFAHMNRVNMMGELAASLSHEITQPIASARNNARAAQNFLHKQTSDLREVEETLDCVVADADRAGDIVDRIRDHIRKAPPRKALCDLNAAINEVVVLARSPIVQNGVSVQSRLAEGLSPVHGDRVQLQQVVLNLILNAVEAMGSTSKAGARELLISTEQDHNCILVAVCDSGPGIDPAHFERVFDAFYTTKPKG
ncbi:MAG TPA: PAS domain-containing protein, partial [Xanthobacteraceae bacterium]|nr:PAS domain-containing protein [Xanthobacteraceae bacterium]